MVIYDRVFGCRWLISEKRMDLVPLNSVENLRPRFLGCWRRSIATNIRSCDLTRNHTPRPTPAHVLNSLPSKAIFLISIKLINKHTQKIGVTKLNKTILLKIRGIKFDKSVYIVDIITTFNKTS